MIVRSGPALSVVVTGRNDDHGGNMLHRMQAFLRGLMTLAEKYQASLELIVVEWNPPPDTKRLKDVLDWSSLGPRSFARIIEVPHALHASLPEADRMPLFQFAGKNVGIRRAEGDFVIATNLDILFSDALMRFLAAGRFSQDCFYRVDRYDVAPEVPLELETDEQLRFCESHVVRFHTVTGSYKPAATLTISQKLRQGLTRVHDTLGTWKRRISGDGIHTLACGDFTMMARERWHALRGYPELASHAYVDGLICYMAVSSGLREVLLRSPMRIYHQEHGQMFLGSTSERPLLDYQQYTGWCDAMLRARKPLMLNDEGWGFGKEELRETRITGQRGGNICMMGMGSLQRPVGANWSGVLIRLAGFLWRPKPNLDGDRDIEWSWILANMGRGPGHALDFGCGPYGYLGLVAARRGFEVTALDLENVCWPYVHPNLRFLQGDILRLELAPSSFDLIINCSSIEHVGLLGRYGSADRPDGDIEAMAKLHKVLKSGGTMLLTIPVGRDHTFAPLHRVYGKERLPRLLGQWEVHTKEFWTKNDVHRWVLTEESEALDRQPSPYYYALGLFVLQRKARGS